MLRIALFGLLSCAAADSRGAELKILAVEEPPGSYTTQSGEVRGISVDYLREIQRRTGNTDPIEIVPETEALVLAKSRPNIVALSFSRNGEREKQFHWIGQVFRKPWVVYTRKGSTLQIKSVDDMRRIPRIGVTEGDVRAGWLEQQGFTNLVLSPTPEAVIANLLAGKVDALFFEPQGIAFYCRSLKCPPGEPVNAYSPRSSEVYILMSKGTPEATVKKWKDAAAQIKSDGTFEKIARKWIKKSALEYGIDSTLVDGVLIFR
ncbi:MAG: substrate-binding periplasmic protein [Pseudomonadota bacterium]